MLEELLKARHQIVSRVIKTQRSKQQEQGCQPGDSNEVRDWTEGKTG